MNVDKSGDLECLYSVKAEALQSGLDIIMMKKLSLFLDYLQSCHQVSTSHPRQQGSILMLFLFLFGELNFVELLFRFARPL